MQSLGEVGVVGQHSRLVRWLIYVCIYIYIYNINIHINIHIYIHIYIYIYFLYVCAVGRGPFCRFEVVPESGLCRCDQRGMSPLAFRRVGQWTP